MNMECANLFTVTVTHDVQQLDFPATNVVQKGNASNSEISCLGRSQPIR